MHGGGAVQSASRPSDLQRSERSVARKLLQNPQQICFTHGSMHHRIIPVMGRPTAEASAQQAKLTNEGLMSMAGSTYSSFGGEAPLCASPLTS